MIASWPPRSIATRQWVAADETESVEQDNHQSSISVRHALLSPDGTTLVASAVHQSNWRSTLDSTVIPQNLLDGSNHVLEQYSAVSLPEPIRAISIYPFYDLSDPSTTLILLSLPDHPLRVVNALALDSGLVASFPHIRPETEEYIAAQSLVFTSDARYFAAGADSEVSLFDFSRPGYGAVQRYRLRRQSQLNQRGQWHLKRSIVSAMCISHDDILAVGTFGREVGLFDRGGQGDMITSFDLGSGRAGAGITQVKWSACGRYLLVGERKSDCLQVFDIRGQSRLLSTLVGRNAKSMMQLHWDITSQGDVWAGGTDGMVRTWQQVGMSEGEVTASFSWQAHQQAVVSTVIHDSGSVAITTSATDRNKVHFSPGSTDDLSPTTTGIECSREDSDMAIWDLRQAEQEEITAPS